MTLVTVEARNANEAVVGCGGVLSVVVSFLFSAFGRNLTSVAVKMSSHLVYATNGFYKSCTFSMICKGNSAINCVTVQHKRFQLC
jgi:hypothetical protein